MKLICSRNFVKLKFLYITGNSFAEYPYDFLTSELRSRISAEIINETISFKIRQAHMKKKKIPIIYENFVMIKDVQFKKKANTEFFGVDIPVKSQEEEIQYVEEQPEPEPEEPGQQIGEAFFITEAEHANKINEEKIIPKNIYELQLEEIMHPNKLDYHQFLSLGRLF